MKEDRIFKLTSVIFIAFKVSKVQNWERVTSKYQKSKDKQQKKYNDSWEAYSKTKREYHYTAPRISAPSQPFHDQVLL